MIPWFAFKNEKTGNYENFIVHTNEVGKSGAIVIGSLLAVDTSIKQPQIILIGPVREYVNRLSFEF